MATVYYIEHGDTALDEQNKAQGLIDSGITHKGQQQVARAARKLRGKGIQCIYCSPLKRAKESAGIIADDIKAKVIVRKGLMPLDIGSLAGKKNADMDPYLEFYSTRPSLKFPDGEAFGDFYARSKKEWAHQFQDSEPVIAVVAHGRDYQLLKHWSKKGFDAGLDGIKFDEPGSAEVVKLQKHGNAVKMQAVG